MPDVDSAARRRTIELDAEQIDWLARLLANTTTSSSHALAPQLARAVSASMASYLEIAADTTGSRSLHNQLRRLWKLVDCDDPPIGQIRSQFRHLPVSAIAMVARRVAHIWPELQITNNESIIAWSRAARAENLLKVLRVALADGGRIVQGRRRPGGQRSRPTLEPIILGIARGAQPAQNKRRGPAARSKADKPSPGPNGRPRATAEQTLVAWLAIDWALATGSIPSPGRSDGKPFGDFVHNVFSWLDLNNAASCLRRYWKAVTLTEHG